MAETTATRRAAKRASVADVKKTAAGHGSSKLRIFGILLLLGIAGGSIAVAYWQPPQVTERLASAWNYAGPWLIVGPTLLISTYIALRIFGFTNLRVWRWAGAALLGTAAILAGMQFFGLTEMWGVSIENILSGYLVDFSNLTVYVILAGLALVTIILLSPIGTFRAARASGRAGRAAGVASANAAAAGGAAARRRVEDARASRASTDEDETTFELDQAPIPRTRIVVPEPARATTRPRYPEPVGVVRDQQKRVQQEFESAKDGEVRKSTPRFFPASPATRRRRRPQPFVNGTRPRNQGLLKEVVNQENARQLEEKPLFIPPPRLRSIDDEQS